MFLNPIWSLLLLALPVVVYVFIIRPRLGARFVDIYAGLDSFWARVWARTYAFRTFWITVAWAVFTAAPDLLVEVSTLDFSPWLPQPWAAFTSPAALMLIKLMKAFETKPGESK